MSELVGQTSEKEKKSDNKKDWHSRLLMDPLGPPKDMRSRVQEGKIEMGPSKHMRFWVHQKTWDFERGTSWFGSIKRREVLVERKTLKIYIQIGSIKRNEILKRENLDLGPSKDMRWWKIGKIWLGPSKDMSALFSFPSCHERFTPVLFARGKSVATNYHGFIVDVIWCQLFEESACPSDWCFVCDCFQFWQHPLIKKVLQQNPFGYCGPFSRVPFCSIWTIHWTFLSSVRPLLASCPSLD